MPKNWGNYKKGRKFWRQKFLGRKILHWRNFLGASFYSSKNSPTAKILQRNRKIRAKIDVNLLRKSLERVIFLAKFTTISLVNLQKRVKI